MSSTAPVSTCSHRRQLGVSSSELVTGMRRIRLNKLPVSDRSTLGGLTQFLRRSAPECPETVDCKSHRGRVRSEGGFYDRLFRTARNALILNGEMSEWLKEHAWKACVRETVPRVRIPFSPPAFAHAHSPKRELSIWSLLRLTPYRRVGRPKPPVGGIGCCRVPERDSSDVVDLIAIALPAIRAVIPQIRGGCLPSLSA